MGKEFIFAVAQDYDLREVDIWKKLTEDELADLFIWLEGQLPYKKDPKWSEGARFYGPKDHVADFRRNLLNHLTNRGTFKAVNALKRMLLGIPHLDMLKWSLIQARNIALRKTWFPPKPCHLIKLADNPNSRLVQSGKQLLSVVIESLKRFEIELQGETPAARDIWDKTDKGDFFTCR